jgi:hypothetical protein
MEYSADRLPFMKFDVRLPVLSEEGTPLFKVLLPECTEYESSVICADLTTCSVRAFVRNGEQLTDVRLNTSILGIVPLFSDGSPYSETVWSERPGGSEPSITIRPTCSSITKNLIPPTRLFPFHRALKLMLNGNIAHRESIQPTKHLFLFCKKIVYRSMDNPDLCFYYTPTIEDMLATDWTISD